ncbi:uncharacterized protein LOC132696888 isoform X2 [Cylas formicarius]|uniref:uncharacterized protein LOC132696888 isoform X2 n=1 Tax=Cylas formicarius TaxID=197179 RepID=UPI002958915E|nr:uncharacterized protein LOC132696888 isoform X2 [Cylas formicarius]
MKKNGVVAMPAFANNEATLYQQLPYQPHTRGPFDFIGNWIQQSSWFPVEINVPDTFANIGNGLSQVTQNLGNGFNQFTQGVTQATSNLGNGVSQLSQNVGNGVSQFSQNVGSGVNQFTQGIGSNWNQLSQNFNNWAQNLGQRIPIISNFVRHKVPGSGLIVVVPVGGSDVGIKPAGVGVNQVLGDEVLESFP